ncbi:MAG: hypothetical protein PHT49_11035 [Desulfovibrionales bacterium]|nr:hypothetical protein [Desulfovibrionales bacterium]
MEGQQKDIEVTSTVTEFFYEQVKNAIQKQKVSLSEISEWYAVNLLSRYAIAYDSDINASELDLEKTPVCIVYHELIKQSLPQRIKGYKAIGDFTLFTSGFFSDSLMRKLFDIDYYIAFGIKSYNALSHIYDYEYWDKNKSALFAELTDKFKTFIDIFAEVRDTTEIENNGGLLRLYERWIKTQSHRDEGLLRAQGIIPNHNADLKTIH